MTDNDAASDEEWEEFHPPENFALVEKGVYRSAFPMRKNFPYLARLGLRSILTLILEDYPEANVGFNAEHGVTLFQFGLEGNKEPFRHMPLDTAVSALREVMDPRNHPILIHCNEGKHRTGSLVGMLRRARGWALASIFDEYMLFAGPKGRMVDQRFIEMFDPSAAAPLLAPRDRSSPGAVSGAAASPADADTAASAAAPGAATTANAI